MASSIVNQAMLARVNMIFLPRDLSVNCVSTVGNIFLAVSNAIEPVP